MEIKEIAQKDGILVREIDGKIYIGGAMAWIALAIELYNREVSSHSSQD